MLREAGVAMRRASAERLTDELALLHRDVAADDA